MTSSESEIEPEIQYEKSYGFTFIPDTSDKKKYNFTFISEEQKPKELSFGENLKEYGKTALKGFAKGVTALGRTMGPLQESYQGEYSKEKQAEVLNKFFPTENESFGQKALERGLTIAPTAIASPFGGPTQAAIRSGIAGITGETAAHYGFGELGQSIAEMSAFVAPGILKKLVEKGKYSDLIKFARKYNMTDEQITPLLQAQAKQNWLSKFTHKIGKTEKRLSSSKKALDKTYDTISESSAAKSTLSPKDSNDLLTELGELGKSLPVEVRQRIAKDMQDLVSGPITGQSLMNLWKDINYYLGKGEKQLGILKGPLKKAIEKVSPELAKDFETINGLYSKFYPIAKKLKPGFTDTFISGMESLGLLGSVATWNVPAIKILIGEKAAKLLSREMLINPRFQQIGHKFVIAMNENKMPLMYKAFNELRNLLIDIDPNIESSLPDYTDEEISNTFNPKKQTK